MTARRPVALATISVALLFAPRQAKAQGGTAHVDVTGAMSESFDLMLVGNQTYDASGRVNLVFLGRNNEEFYVRLTPPITTRTYELPASFDTDGPNITIVPSTQPPFGNLTIVSSTSSAHENSCTATIDYKDDAGVRGSFRCTFDRGQIQASGTFATTEAAAPAGPPPEAMALGLACDRNDLQEYGRVTCNAAVSNMFPNAQITYRWTVDGTDRSETGRDLSLTDIAVGDHTIAVSAFDQANTISIGSQSVSLTRYAAGTPQAEEAGKFGGNLKPILAGAAIAISIALGGIILNGRKPRTPDLTEKFKNKPAPKAKPVLSRPLSGPEDFSDSKSDRKKDRSRPTLTVKIILRPSVLVQQLYNSNENKILGDTVDFTFVGYELQVGPYGEWEIDYSMPRYGGELHAGNLHAIDATWTVSGGEWKPVNEFAKIGEADFRNLPSNDPWATRTDSNNAVIFSRKWYERDDAMTVAVKVRARVRSTDHTEIDYVEAIDMATEPLVIVGAKPDLSLTATTPNRKKMGLRLEEGGTITGSADGTDKIRVDPVLYLFDGIYSGGLGIASIDRRAVQAAPPDPALGLDDFFEVIRDDPRVAVDGGSYVDQPTKSMMREGLTLRCRFRLDKGGLSRIPEDGFPLRMTIEPTGSAYGLETQGRRFDWVLRDHYKACAAQYKLNPLPVSRPVKLRLVPATIEVLAPEPSILPIVATGDDRFTSKVRARLKSFHGDDIKGAEARRDITKHEVENWHFRFWYDPPEEKWRKEIDPGLTREEGLELNASGIDDDGYIVFDGKPFLRYDHEKHFRKPVKRAWRPEDADEQNFYIRAQTCDVEFEFRALSDRFRDTVGISPDNWISFKSKKPIHVDIVEREFYKVTVHVQAISGEPLAGAEVALGPDSSPQWLDRDWLVEGRSDRVTRGTTDTNGDVTLYMVPGRFNPYRIRSEWTTAPSTGIKLPISLNPNEPPFEPLTGTHVIEESDDFHSGDGSSTFRMSVSTQWALQTDISASAGASIGVVGGGVIYMNAILINRAEMPKGGVPGGWKEFLKLHPPPNIQQWRRLVLAGLFGSIGEGALEVIGVDISDPGDSPFRTATPVAFDDFHTARCIIESTGGSYVRGQSRQYATFRQIATDPVNIDLSSESTGVSGATVLQTVYGKWLLID